MTWLDQVTELLRQCGTTSELFLTEIVFAAAKLVVVDRNGDVFCDLRQKNATFELLTTS